MIGDFRRNFDLQQVNYYEKKNLDSNTMVFYIFNSYARDGVRDV